MTPPFHFECPYCNRPTTIQQNDYEEELIKPAPTGKDTGTILYVLATVVCPSPDCRKTTVAMSQWRAARNRSGGWEIDPETKASQRSWRLMPRSRARQYPEYVPVPVREDYEEAHLILKDSPKASATLARRALQGIMRDFYGAKPGTLYDEITEVAATGKMDAGLVKATHAVRDVGNIGAHMSKDISVIVPVEPGEAEALLGLIELLLDETYVARHSREQRVNAVLQVAADKQALRAAGGSKAPPGGGAQGSGTPGAKP
jgi:hypothetical protein